MEHTRQDTAMQSDTLNAWLATATRGLCDDARERISTEIPQHIAVAIDDCRDRGMDDPLSLQQAERQAVASLGDPRKARRSFKKIHLTKREAALWDYLNSDAPEHSFWFIVIPFLLIPAPFLAFWVLFLFLKGRFEAGALVFGSVLLFVLVSLILEHFFVKSCLFRRRLRIIGGAVAAVFFLCYVILTAFDCLYRQGDVIGDVISIVWMVYFGIPLPRDVIILPSLYRKIRHKTFLPESPDRPGEA